MLQLARIVLWCVHHLVLLGENNTRSLSEIRIGAIRWYVWCFCDEATQIDEVTPVIKDCCKILDNTVIPPNMVIPSFSVVAGNPGKLPYVLSCAYNKLYQYTCVYVCTILASIVDELPETSQACIESEAVTFYNNFQPRQ
jgi:hypothetical protein